VAVTGIAGFVGAYLAAELKSAGYAVCGTVLNAAERDRTVAAGITDVTIAELNDMDALRRGFSGARLIVHLAAISSGAAGAEAWKANVDGTRNVLAAADGRRVLLVSTGYVYGKTTPERPARETDPLDPIGDYAASKAEMERMANTEFAGADIVIARSFNHTGPGQGPAFVAPAFAQQIAQIEAGTRDPVLRVGNLDALREMMDVRDVVKAYTALIGLPPAAGRVFNVACGRPHSVHHILDVLLSRSSASIGVETDPARLRPSDNPCSTGDATKLRAATGWAPEIPLERTLEDTLNGGRKRSGEGAMR
jgi:GDP-4-dehydro-6-deoxy-D-mannose reductase